MLTETHKLLEGHFKKLSHERIPHGYPVYAFEHGLDAEHVEKIRAALCDELVRTQQLRREHWLLWTVVAAEIGYTYDGDEYWMSFASEIPRWSAFGSRDTVRDWFRDFTVRFTGFTPSGRWAEHFSIIAWPITHSILPRYLQAHFARHLYDLRHDLAATNDTSVDRLGALLEERYYGGSSRFENFLQQSALTARLVLALRDEDVQDTVSPIHRPTLSRIIADLEKKALSRGYLRDARRVLRDARVHVRPGLGGVTAPSASPATTARSAGRGLRLVAKRSSDNSWTVGAALPEMAALLAQAKVKPDVLDSTRLRFADKPEGWMPARALLGYSGREHALMALPNPLSEPLVHFEDKLEGLDRVSAELTFYTRAPWVLRVHNDGVARQVFGNNIRTGETYLIVTQADVQPEIAKGLGLAPAICRTAGLTIHELRAPATANHVFLLALSKLSLGYLLRANVEPVGLVPRWNAATGSSSWLPNENILLKLSADFDVSEFALSLNGASVTRFPLGEQKEFLVSLGTLPVGRHTVEITAAARKSVGAMTVAPETITLEVRPPIPWQQGIQRTAGLRLVVEPPKASLEDLVAKRATVSIHGPSARFATAQARLFDQAGHLSQETELGRIALPSNDFDMARLIDKLRHDPLAENIQSAPRIDLAFKAEELGTTSASFTHPVPPLRWRLAGTKNEPLLRLIDEFGTGTGVLVDRYDMAVPDKRIDLDPKSCMDGVPLAAPGGLFVARHEGRMYSAVASVLPKERLSTFSDLNLAIELAVPGESAKSIMRLLAIMRLWRRGRLYGPLAAVRKAKVLDVLERQVERLACGDRWADRAQRYRIGQIEKIEDLQGDVGGSPGFASRMRTTTWTWHSDSVRARAEFLRLAKTYRVSGNATLCELALRLAFNPASIRLSDPKKGAETFHQLGANEILTRGAFFAKLTSDLRFREAKTAGETQQ